MKKKAASSKKKEDKPEYEWEKGLDDRQKKLVDAILSLDPEGHKNPAPGLRFFNWLLGKKKDHEARESSDQKRRKYHAALLMLTNLSLQQIAEFTANSYDLLRRWKWEVPFVGTVKQLIDEYVEYFAQNCDFENETATPVIYCAELRLGISLGVAGLIKDPPGLAGFLQRSYRIYLPWKTAEKRLPESETL